MLDDVVYLEERMMMKKLLVIGLLLAVCLIAGPAAANTLYVDDDGYADASSCDSLTITPYTTIQSAINAAAANDVIMVCPGTYDPAIDARPPCWGGSYPAQGVVVWKDGLTIKAVNPDPTQTRIESSVNSWMDKWRIQILTGGSYGTPPNCFPISGGFDPKTSAAPSAIMVVSDGVTIEGFTIYSSYIGDPNAPWNYPNTAGVFIGGVAAGDTIQNGVTGTTVKNCVITGWSGIYNWRSPDTIIEGNTISIIPLSGQGISPNGAGIIVFDSWYQGTSPTYPSSPSSTNVQILNNIIDTSMVDPYGDEGQGIMFGGVDDPDHNCDDPPGGPWVCDPTDDFGVDQSGFYIDGNTITAATDGVKLWYSYGDDKVMTCNNVVIVPSGFLQVKDYSSDSTYNGPFPDYCQDGTGTPGYWMNHPEAWPFDEITIGGVIYTKDEAIELMLQSTSKDVTYTMFQSLVAAKLNVLVVGYDSSCILDTISDADTWMATYGPVGSGVKAGGKTSPWRTGEPLYLELDAYNNGYLCVPHRSG